MLKANYKLYGKLLLFYPSRERHHCILETPSILDCTRAAVILLGLGTAKLHGDGALELYWECQVHPVTEDPTTTEQ